MNRVQITLFRIIVIVSTLQSIEPSKAQIIGGRENGISLPQEVKSTIPNKGAISGDVNLFTGTYQTSYDLGTVSTISGLSFSLSLNYNSVFTNGNSLAMTSGIPYGEGWSLNIPSVTITSVAYNEYGKSDYQSKASQSGDANKLYFNEEEAGHEGELCWFAPTISIPGVISERFVFKYFDDAKGEAVFVPHQFSNYVEARFKENEWFVILEDGTIYRFAMAIFNMMNPSNQRVAYDFDEATLMNLVFPKKFLVQWYCSDITRPTDAGDPNIIFNYITFSKPNYFKEYLQPYLWEIIQSDYFPASEMNSTYFTCYDEAFLTDIYAGSGHDENERIVLEYATPENFTNDYVNNFPNQLLCFKDDDNVRRRDSLYSYKTIYSYGVNTLDERNMLGEMAGYVSPEKFNDWQRYFNLRSDKAQDDLELNYPQLSPLNPYAASVTDPPGSDPVFYYREKVKQGSGGDDEEVAIFDHCFLESPRLGEFISWDDPQESQVETNLFRTDFPAGDVYEIKTYIYNIQGLSDETFCNFDINIVSGELISETSDQGLIGSIGYDKRRNTPVFSTFNQPIKWNPASTSDGKLITSNYFVMPNLPREFEGFNVQIGPANSDQDFNSPHTTVAPGTVNEPVLPSNYYSYFSVINTPNGWNNTLDPTNPIPNNFGIGQPWYMVREMYDKLYGGEVNGLSDEIYNNWWNNSANYNPNHQWENIPTQADDNFRLIAAELIRYSKNPYMLQSVSHYKMSGERNASLNLGGKNLVRKVEMTYDFVGDKLLNNLWDEVNSPTSYTGKRYIFLLKKVKEIPTSPADNSISTTYTNEELPTVSYEYTKYENTDFTESTRINGSAVALTQIIDQLGGTTEIEYYPLSALDIEGTRIIFRNIPNSLTSIDLTNVKVANNNIVQIQLAVKTKTLQAQEDQSVARQWDYAYENPVVSKTIWGGIDDLGVHFHSTDLDYQEGYALVTVEEPKFATQNTTRNYSIYEFFGNALGSSIDYQDEEDRSNDLLFGMPSKVSVYDADGNMLKQNETLYDCSIAYYNAAYLEKQTNSFNKPLDSDYFEFDAGDPLPDNGFEFSRTPFGESSPLIETLNPAAFSTFYLNSWFTKKIKETVTEYAIATLSSGSIYDVVESEISSGFASSLRSSGQYKEIEVTGCGGSPVLKTPIVAITDYEYWDGFPTDQGGGAESDCAGYGLLLETHEGSPYLINHNPSWQLYSKKSYSPQLPDAFNKEEYFYYYDLRHNITPVEEFAALFVSVNAGIRSIIYEKRTTRKTSGLEAVRHSDYYWYDDLWESNGFQPAVAEITLTEQQCEDVDNGGEIIDDIGISSNVNENSVNRENLDYSDYLNDKLLYRETVTQVDTNIILDPPGFDDFDFNQAKILRFRLVTSPVSMYVPFYPCDTLVLDNIALRNIWGQVLLARDEKRLFTRYYYNYLTNVTYHCIGEDYSGIVWNNIGMPVASTVGPGYFDIQDGNKFKFLAIGDSLRSEYQYYSDNSLKSIIDPNGMEISYTYDKFGRLLEDIRNDTRLHLYDYHLVTIDMEENENVTFNDLLQSNYVDVYSFHGSVDKAIHTRTHYDPLGNAARTLSQISPNANTGALGNSMVFNSIVTYDAWQRPVKSYKPFKITGGSTVSFEDICLESTCYSSQPHASSGYENNLNSRKVSESQFGENLKKGHRVSYIYSFMSGIALSSELMLSMAEKSEVFPYGVNSSYRYRKNMTVDEDGKKTIVYLNAFGQQVATKQYENETSPVVTLFFYDSQGNQRKVINPAKQASTFKYNLLGWLFEKTTVDNGLTRMMFNRSGQVVLQQEANGITFEVTEDPTEDGDVGDLRKFEYDDFGRLTKQSKVFINEGAFNPLRYKSINIDVGPFYYEFTLSTTCDWIYQWRKIEPTDPWFKISPYGSLSDEEDAFLEKEWHYHFTDPNIPSNISGSAFFSNNPQDGLKGRLSYTISYTDSKPEKKADYCLYSYNSDGFLDWEIHDFEQPVVGSVLTAAIHYPSYNFTGNLQQEKVDVGLNGIYEKTYDYVYDDWNRLSMVKADSRLTAQYYYDDALGLLLKTEYIKYPGQVSCIEGDQTSVLIDDINYTYDIRNRLTKIDGKFFEEQLYYDGNHPQTLTDPFRVLADNNYNGNINAAKSSYSLFYADNDPEDFTTEALIYGYKYDQLNRLTTADACPLNNLPSKVIQNFSYPATHYGDESYSYDKVGNILNLTRHIYYWPGSSPVDEVNSWHYQYYGNNRLTYIVDNFTTNTLWNYSYDANGNTLTDGHHSITSSIYGRSNLPLSMNGDGYALSYLYNVNDQRIYKKEVGTGGTINSEEYYLLDAMGRTLGIYDKKNSGAWTWYVYGKDRIGKADQSQYYEYDHLGNSRVTYNCTLSCVSNELHLAYTLDNVIDYYPFGKVLRKSVVTDEDRFLFTGKERDQKTDYDYFGARYYDGDIGRFLSVDPMGDSRITWSSFNYARCNPILNIDPLGLLDGHYLTADGYELGTDGHDDDLAYTADGVSVNEDGSLSFVNAQLLNESYSDIMTMSATIYGEGSSNQNELFAIGSTIKNYADITNQSIESLLSDDGYAIAVGKEQFNNFLNMSDRNVSVKAMASIGATINAISGGRDLSSGGLYWDHKDLRTNSSHEKRRMGLFVNGKFIQSGNIGYYNQDLHTKSLGRNSDGSYLGSQAATHSRALSIGVKYTYETTAGVGNCTFTRLTNNAIRAGLTY